ncbi:MAG TPA: helix-turn-helix transcriptional regulator [Streptosporangiaceae bacterium]|jgi:transcriptional regulator with XRE-family HTH domain|nr:helix-turn-helix transcriptional regulator [Streptosporangiaceae bacterium]
MSSEILSGPGSLGEFLRSRRARLSPAEAGIASYGARRVPGLRREELAQVAGVSTTYYTRLEQGHGVHASAEVIEAIAAALKLNEDERAHLRDLARPARPRRRRPAPPAAARGGTARLIAAMTDVPALIMDRRSDVLAWNRLGHALLAGHLDSAAPDRAAGRPNLTRMLFLDPRTRELYPRWAEEAARAVASLRMVAGRYRDDRGLSELVGELTVQSDEFARLWSRQPVLNCFAGIKQFRHPVVGEFELEFEVLHLPDDSGQRILAYTAIPGTASAGALLLLASSAAPAELSTRRA